MSIDGITGSRGVTAPNGGPGPGERGRGTELPALPGDAGGYATGIEFAAAMLASKSAEAIAKIAKEGQRAAKLEQVAQQRAQSDALRDKASLTRSQALLSGSLSIGGGVASGVAAVNQGSSPTATVATKIWGIVGKTQSDTAQPAGNFFFGARVINVEADANTYASRAKTAEGFAEDYAALEKQARSVMEKATSIMQALVQERQAITRSILRAG